MGSKSQAVNQNNVQTNQNYNFDINAIYSDFIQQINANRSYTNIQTNNTALEKFDANTVGGIVGGLKIENTAQESRAHTFYRLIGFPVVDKDGNMYNPGLDIMAGSNERLIKKVGIANKQDPKFLALSLQRENYTNNILNVFRQTPPTITASALALSSNSRINTRSFAVPTINTDALSFFPGDQKYSVNWDSKVGQEDIDIHYYRDANGNAPDSGFLSSNRYHFIQPFIVDARIDFTVSPLNSLSQKDNEKGKLPSRVVAVPFVDSNKSLLIGENTYAKRPLIEKVIRDRLTATQDATITEGQQETIDYIKNTSSIKNDALISQMVDSPYIKNNPALFVKYVAMIQAMCQALVDAQKRIQFAQSQYYWIPLVSTAGPEGGSTVNGIIIQSDNVFPEDLITTADSAIIGLTLQQYANSFQTASAPVAGIADPGGFIFEGSANLFKLTFDETTSASLGDTVSEQLDKLNKERTRYLSDANDALKTIEIIMGEWSGLGLCDIIAVMASLYTMDQDMLLGFLDDDAIGRMTDQTGIVPISGVGGAGRASVTDALNSFVGTVNDYYHLMDDLYNILAVKNNISS